MAEDDTLGAELLCGWLQREAPKADVHRVGSLSELGEGPPRGLLLLSEDWEEGIDWLVARELTGAKVVALVRAGRAYPLHRLLQAMVPGIVHRRDGLGSLARALEIVGAGGSFLSPAIQERRAEMRADPRCFGKILSPREVEVLVRCAPGGDMSAHARGLGLRESTLRDHRKNIMLKLGVHNQAELLAYALQGGFVRLAAPAPSASVP